MYKRGTSQNQEKQEKIDEIMKGMNLGKKKWVRYSEGALLYSMGVHSFMDISKKAIVIGAMVLLIGFGIGYCIYSHRYQEIIIFLVVGMIMMAGMFAVTVVEGICDTLTEKISDL